MQHRHWPILLNWFLENTHISFPQLFQISAQSHHSFFKLPSVSITSSNRFSRSKHKLFPSLSSLASVYPMVFSSSLSDSIINNSTAWWKHHTNIRIIFSLRHTVHTPTFEQFIHHWWTVTCPHAPHFLGTLSQSIRAMRCASPSCSLSNTQTLYPL